MKYLCPLIAVTDMEKSKKFYHDVLELEVVEDFGANVSLTGGLSLQTMETWKEFIHTDEVQLKNNAGELYFEEEDIDAFTAKLNSMNVSYVHPLFEHRWGQRVVRFYDPDGHIIEVGEKFDIVVKRFAKQGMTEKEISVRMDIPTETVNFYLMVAGK